MSKVRRLFSLVAFAIALCTFATAAFAAKGAANVSISVAKQAFAAGDSVAVEVTISNPNRGAIRILRWFTPVDDVEEPLFNVMRDEAKVEYIGAHYKRSEPTDKDFIILKGGESITRTIDLAEYYDLSVTGTYAVSYDVASFDLYQKGNPTMENIQELKSGGLQIWIEGRAVKTPEPEAPTEVAGSNSYTKCTTSQQSSLVTARNEAAVYSSGAVNYLNGSLGVRYTTWFGTYTQARYNIVDGNFDNIKSAMDGASVGFNCGCKKQYYAYVYSNQPYNIYLCRAFWTAPMTGTDSKAGTLIHEMSHFTVVAGTNDWVYGQTGAKNLAISNPNNAVDNADNHEYFAENTPFQP
jgi:peptidyl-Lys metalloendopeptidase